MKKIWVYLLGILTGIALTFIAAVIINASNSYGMKFFDEPGEVFYSGDLTVFQALGNSGLAHEGGYNSVTVLVYNPDGEPYYDGQIVSPGYEECFRHVGIYRYKSKDDNYRTVPIVAIYPIDYN